MCTWIPSTPLRGRSRGTSRKTVFLERELGNGRQAAGLRSSRLDRAPRSGWLTGRPDFRLGQAGRNGQLNAWKDFGLSGFFRHARSSKRTKWVDELNSIIHSHVHGPRDHKLEDREIPGGSHNPRESDSHTSLMLACFMKDQFRADKLHAAPNLNQQRWWPCTGKATTWPKTFQFSLPQRVFDSHTG